VTTDALDVAHERLHAAAAELDQNHDSGAENHFARDALLYAEWEFLSEVDVWLRERLPAAAEKEHGG
jgi:hypothetical protein